MSTYGNHWSHYKLPHGVTPESIRAAEAEAIAKGKELATKGAIFAWSHTCDDRVTRCYVGTIIGCYANHFTVKTRGGTKIKVDYHTAGTAEGQKAFTTFEDWDLLRQQTDYQHFID